MNRIFVVAFLLTGVLLSAAPARVQVKETSVYAKPTPLSKFLGKVTLGTELTIVSEKDGWTEIKTKGLGGWIRSQAYTTAPLNLKSTGDTGAGVSATEVSLAGRGFTEQVESEYKKNNPQLDFSRLDAMEASGISADELVAFLGAR